MLDALNRFATRSLAGEPGAPRREPAAAAGRQPLVLGATPTLLLAHETTPAVGPAARIGGMLTELRDILREAGPADLRVDCPGCQGSGTVVVPSVELVVPYPERSLPGGASRYFGSVVDKPDTRSTAIRVLAAEEHVDLTKPWCELPEAFRSMLLHGSGSRKVRVPDRRARQGRPVLAATPLLGAFEHLSQQYRTAPTAAAKDRLGQYMADLPCGQCRGLGLSPSALGACVLGSTVSSVLTAGGSDLLNRCRNWQRDGMYVPPGLMRRLSILRTLGAGDFPLAAQGDGLSPADRQCLRLADLLSFPLDGMTYLLDRPSAALPATAARELAVLLTSTCVRGNTVIVADDDPAVVEAADATWDASQTSPSDWAVLQ